MTNLSELDQLVERVSGRIGELAAANASLQDELSKMKMQLDSKELEKIRALKEKDRAVERLEREKMNLQKDKEVLESKIDGIVKSLKSILPDAGFERR